MKTRVLVFALLVLAAGCKHKAARTNPAGCGGPNYPCALHQIGDQLTVVPLPAATPAIGGLVGANKRMTVQPYGSIVVRCTDVNTDPTNEKQHSFEVTDGGGAGQIQWNANQTLLRVVNADTGSTRVLGFNKVNYNCRTTVNQYSAAPSGATWSLLDPNVDYILNGTVVTRRQFDATQPMVAPIVTQYFDFADCGLVRRLHLHFLSTTAYLDDDSPEVTSSGALSTADDQIFLASFSTTGGQDTAQWLMAYRHVPGQSDGCSMVNTQTGEVMADNFGEGGHLTNFHPFLMHAANMSPSGIAVTGPAAKTCPECPDNYGPFFWYPGSTRMDVLLEKGKGHSTRGNKLWVNLISSPVLLAHPYADLTVMAELNEKVTLPQPQETHVGWQNTDVSDTYPICGSQMSLNQPLPRTITSPLENEIWCVEPLTGAYIRLAPTMSTGTDNGWNFRTKNAIIANGKFGFIAFSSDWMGTLGNTDGVTTACTPGAKKPNACRSDVFIIVPH